MKLLSIVGTSTQFLKLTPLSKLFEDENIDHIVIHTGQHYDNEMSSDIFKVLNIKEPDYLFKEVNKSEINRLCSIMNNIEKICIKEKPDVMIVFGDCDTTLAGSIVSKKQKIFLVHIEAGMRSYNKEMPEEINRVMTDHISDLLLCSTQDSVDKLKKENITKNVHYVGNLQCELLGKISKTYNNKKILIENNLIENNFVLMTIHRDYNTNKKTLLRYFNEIKNLEKEVIFPIHPRTLKVIKNNEINVPENVKLINPVNYLDMTILKDFVIIS